MDIDPSNDRDHDGKRKDKKEAITQILAAEWEVGAAPYFCTNAGVSFNLPPICELSFGR